MHILTVCNDLAYFNRHRRFVTEHLAARAHDVTVVVGGPEPTAGAASPYIHVPIARFSFAPLLDLALALKLLSLIRRRRPDAAHLITVKPAVVGGLAAIAARMFLRRPRRIVLTLAGLGRLLAPSPSASRSLRVSRALTMAVLRWLSHRRDVFFTFETRHDAAVLLREGLSDTRVAVLAGAGVDPAVFFPAARRSEGRPLRVLFASRLLWSKGLDTFLACAARMQASGVEFLVAGIGEPAAPDAVDPATLARDPSINFLGEVTAMAELIRSVDLVCLPTRYGEGIPRILIEAAACGVASIASDLEGCREIVRDGESGRLLASRDAESGAAELESVLRDYLRRPELIERHGAAALQRFFAGGFAQERIAAAFEQLLCGTAGPEGTPRGDA